MRRRFFSFIREAVRRYFVAGILFFAPIGVTVWAIVSIIVWLDNLLLPRFIKLVMPGIEDPPSIPLVGMLFTFVVIIFLGVIARHLLGGEFQRAWERLLARVPIARSIYGGVKQLAEAIFASSAQSTRFRRVVLVEYPRRGVYALAFTTGHAKGIVQEATEQEMINCFVPTTPNPTSGFYLLVPEEDLIEISLSVEDAFKLVMSAGLVSPESRAVADPADGEPG
ncbi:MAG: DUF502 domain-containing protein [Deltaproteobacteria bacterium]|nr:DUF502 domain-containing protein [Deltaproteobacteria bacterium]